MDRTKFGKAALGIFWGHFVLSIIVLVLTFSNSNKLFMFGFRLGAAVLIIYPLLGGLAYIIISIIGMIKNKKLLPYLICPILSFILWLIVAGSLAAYI